MRILILEDDPWIATDLQVLLEAEGHEIVDALGSLVEAYKHLDDDFDCALLDVDVIGGKSFGLAHALIEREIPFAFVSASSPADLPKSLRQAAFVAKPFEERTLLDSVEHLGFHDLPC
jgi:DNA-binding response OmpR family regulator